MAALPGAATTAVTSAVGQNPATPVSSNAASSAAAAAATTSRAAAAIPAFTTSSAVASSSAAQAAATPVTSSASAAAAASSSVAASSSSAAAAASSSASSRAASSSIASSTSASARSSSASSSRAASSSASVSFAGVSGGSATSNGNNGLSGGAIGGIVGGAVGGLLILALAFLCWRKRRNMDERLPPPPPREMSYAQTTYNRARTQSVAMNNNGANVARASSYSTLLGQQGRTGSSSHGHSRQASYYTSYPIATPTSTDSSPPMQPVEVESSLNNSGVPSGSTTPGGPVLGAYGRPTLPPINTASLRRDDSSSSNEAQRSQPRRIPSVDRLRQEAGMSGDRAPSPVGSAAFHSRTGSDLGTSRPSSPADASRHAHRLSAGMYSPAPGSIGGFPNGRPLSMSSLSSTSRYLHVGPAGGAPHQGRPINLEMPRMLGSQRPASVAPGEMYANIPSMESGQLTGFGEFGNSGRYPKAFPESRDSTQDFGPQVRHVPSSHSLSGQARSPASPQGQQVPYPAAFPTGSKRHSPPGVSSSRVPVPSYHGPPRQ